MDHLGEARPEYGCSEYVTLVGPKALRVTVEDLRIQVSPTAMSHLRQFWPPPKIPAGPAGPLRPCGVARGLAGVFLNQPNLRAARRIYDREFRNWYRCTWGSPFQNPTPAELENVVCVHHGRFPIRVSFSSEERGTGARVASRDCGSVHVTNGDPPEADVRVLSGKVACRRARSVILSGYYHRSLPAGWRCNLGGYPRLEVCSRHSGRKTTGRVGAFAPAE
jgi:hypothetical protein